MSEPLPEIETSAALAELLRTGAPLTGRRIQDVDLQGCETALLARTDLEGLVVLGGHLGPALDPHLRAHGAIVFPSDPAAPVDAYRSRLYTADELYAGLDRSGYASTPDALAYAWLRDPALAHDAYATLLRAIHDDAISDALTEVLAKRPVVGVMGGHALDRGTTGYAAAAQLGHLLADAGLVVATGGGPGAMEAANLGATSGGGAALERALTSLSVVPGFAPDIGAWAACGLEVRATLPPSQGVRSIGIPTWFYGHEPPNVFGDGIAKYFSNAVREDGLLARCTAGIVVLPGAAGTVQEVFQAATRLFYATDLVTPLVLVGREHWTKRLRVWPLLQDLAAGRSMEASVHLVDTASEAATILTRGDANRSATSGQARR